MNSTICNQIKYHSGLREYPVRDSFRSDPEIGRWNRVDPLYYQTPGQSPYSFVSNNPVNHYDVMGLFQVSKTNLEALAYALYEEGDTVDELVNKILDAINSGFSGGPFSDGAGGGLVAARLTSEQFRRYLEYLGYDVRERNNDLEGVDTEPIEVVASKPRYVLVGIGFDSYNFTDNFGRRDVSFSEKIFGPKAKPTDSWLWRAFRGTGNRKKDIFNATMLGLGGAVAAVVAGEVSIAYGDAIVATSAKAYEAVSAKILTASQSIHAFIESQTTFLQSYISNIFLRSKFFYFRNAYYLNDASLSFIANIFPGGQYQPMTPYGQIVEWGKIISDIYNKWYQEMLKTLK